MLLFLHCIVLTLGLIPRCSFAFVQYQGKQPNGVVLSASSPESVLDELSEDRKANLFSYLLRDLEVEGVPLLGCDADQAHTFQAALWTVCSELHEQDGEGKACLVLESMPVESLRSFVDDFSNLKAEPRLMDSLWELKRFNITLLGKGVGPAIVIETSERSRDEKEAFDSFTESFSTPDELKWTSAMKMFVSRMGLEESSIISTPLAYRLVGSPSPGVCDTLSAFWTCICELLSQPEDQLSSIVVCLPSAPIESDHSQDQKRFSAVSEIINRLFFLYRGQDIFELSHFSPVYDRDQIHPKDEAAYGHLPPTHKLRSILKESGKEEEAPNLTDDELLLQNYLRKSPLPAVTIRRGPKLQVEDSSYAANLIKVVGEGKESLQSSLDAELKLIQ